MPSSLSRIGTWVVMVWTGISALAVLSFTASDWGDSSASLGLGLIEVQGRRAIAVALLLGIWALSALALIACRRRTGAVMLLIYSVMGAASVGGVIVQDLTLAVQHAHTASAPGNDWPLLIMTALFAMAAIWAWRRAFAGQVNASVTLLAQKSAAGSSH